MVRVGHWRTVLSAADLAGNTSTPATQTTDGSGVTFDRTAPTVTRLANDEAPTKSKTWTWGNIREVVHFRHVIDQNPVGFPDGAYGEGTTATQAEGDGIFYLHVQAVDEAGNESAVATVYAVLDNTAPAVTGLTDDPVRRQRKVWTWSGTDADGQLGFRHAIDQSPGGTPAGAYGLDTTATKEDADGTWFIHVQAIDRAGNASPVVTVSALLDNTAPLATGWPTTPFRASRRPGSGAPPASRSATGTRSTRIRTVFRPGPMAT